MLKINLFAMTLLIGIGSCAIGPVAEGRQPAPLLTPVKSAGMLERSFGEGERSAIAESRNLREVIEANTADVANVRSLFRVKYGRRAEALLTGEGVTSDRIFNIPGVIKNARLAANPNNKNLAKGALRSHMYARKIDGDDDFELMGMNEPLRTPAGKTDADILFRSRLTGEEFRMEVKQVKPENIRRNVEKYKLQIDKMAEDQPISGRRQVWVNRYGAPPEFRRYAESQGVAVYENVGTGETSALKPGTMPFEKLLDELRNPGQAAQVAGLVGKDGEATAVGAISAVSTESAALETVAAGEELSLLGGAASAGSGWLGGGAALWGVGTGVGIEVIADVFSLYEYNTGRMTNRQLVTQLTGSAIFLSCTAGGAGIGAFAGGVGAIPGAAVGMIVGAVAQSGYYLYHSRREFIGWLSSNDYSPNRLAESVYDNVKTIYYGAKHSFERNFGLGMPEKQQELLNFLKAHYAQKDEGRPASQP